MVVPWGTFVCERANCFILPVKVLNGNSPRFVDITSTSGLIRALIYYCKLKRLLSESFFLRHKRYLMSVPVVSIWRKSDQYSPRYDQKSDGAVMLSPHHGGAVGHIRL